MANEDVIVLEIGTGTVRALAGKVLDDGEVLISGIGEAPSRGVRKGEIVNRDDVIGCVREALSELETNGRSVVQSVVLATSGGETRGKIGRGAVRLVEPGINQKTQVTETDVEEAMANARKTALSENRIRLHTLKRCFELDDVAKVDDPIGMTGEELRAEMLLLHGKRSAVENLRKLVEDVPVTCSDAVFSGMCSGLAVANSEQRRSGVLTIDLGEGTTDYALFFDDALQAAGSLPVGGAHVTSDVAAALKIPLLQAERIKCKEASAVINLLERERTIPIPAESGFSGKVVRSVTLNVVTNARMEEIFMLVKERIDAEVPDVPLVAGVLLTGGGAFLNGVRDLGEKVFNAPCFFGKPFGVKGLPSGKTSMTYAVAVGCIRYVDSLAERRTRPAWTERLLRWLKGGGHG